MARVKDLWLDAYEQLLEAADELGMGDAEAEAFAEQHAHARVSDRMADLADRAKDQWKERGL